MESEFSWRLKPPEGLNKYNFRPTSNQIWNKKYLVACGPESLNRGGTAPALPVQKKKIKRPYCNGHCLRSKIRLDSMVRFSADSSKMRPIQIKRIP